jgi:hypothetical protein
MRHLFAGYAASDRGRDRLEPRVRAIAAPTFQGQCLDFTETKRRLNGIEADRQIDAAPLCLRGLVTDEITVAGNRTLAPGNNHASGGVEVILDVFTPVRARTDVGIPPNRKAVRFEGADQRLQSGLVLSLVLQEHIRAWRGHQQPPTHCQPMNLL